MLGPTGNDLEAAALALAPQVGEALYALKAQPGALTARMSGSGATCFALFAAAAEVGAMAAGADAAKVKALADYGRAIGVAFQLVDDALDYAASADTIGKNAGDDFREGKITLPVILAFARGASDERAFWTRVIADDKQRPEDFDAAVDLIKLRDAIEDTLARAQSYALAAKDAGSGVLTSRGRSALRLRLRMRGSLPVGRSRSTHSTFARRSHCIRSAARRG